MGNNSFLPQYDPAAAEETIKRIEEMNQHTVEAMKGAGNVTFDAHERLCRVSPAIGCRPVALP